MTLGVAGTAPGFRADDISAVLTEKEGRAAVTISPQTGRLGTKLIPVPTMQGVKKPLASKDEMVGSYPSKERERSGG